MAGEPGALVLAIFHDLIERVKSARPVRSDGKDLTAGFVYSQLVLGQPVDPRDFMDPWSPMLGASRQREVGVPSQSDIEADPDPKFRKAIDAAFKTSELVDSMLMVTNDGSYLQYPTTRHVSFAYEGIINGMQSMPAPPVAPEVQKQIDEAMKVLYELDEEDGSIIGNTRGYDNYLDNAQAYADAKEDYAIAQEAALNDPRQANSWPMRASSYQRRVDRAWDDWKTQGAEKYERALDVLKSVGISMQNHMIAKARSLYDVWSLGLAGVSTPVPYSYILPTSWCDPDDDNGWQELEISEGQINRFAASSTDWITASGTSSSASGSSGGVGVFAGFGSLGARGSKGKSRTSSNSEYEYESSNRFRNDAKGLTIKLKYALCTVKRPWFIGDLFYLQNWYLVNSKENAISDGTIANQVEKEEPILPMVPVQFLAVKDVVIEATDWGEDGSTFAQMQGESHSSSSSSGSSAGGAFAIGPIFGGGSTWRNRSSSSSSSESSSDWRNRFHTDWHNEKLTIHGTQILLWLSEVVPSCPDIPDPNLSTDDDDTSDSSDTTESANATVGVGAMR